MTVPKISLNDYLKAQNTDTTVKQNTVAVNYSTPDDLQRQPQEDTFNGKSDKKKILTYASIGTVIATLVGIAIDFKFAEGKHVKSIFGKAGNKGGSGGTGKPNVNPKNTTQSATSTAVNTSTAGTSGSQVTNKTSTTPTLQQTKSSPNHSSSQTAPVNNVNVSSNVSTDKMRAYVSKKYNNGKYRQSPSYNYAAAMYQNYLGIRICPKDYYVMNKSYDTKRLFDITSKGGKDIWVYDNDGMGWFYRNTVKNGQKIPEIQERISLNVYPDENLIKALDDFITRTNENVYYKVPQAFNDWVTRHDPITMYFAKNPSQRVKDEIIRIVSPYIRKSPKGEVMLGTKLSEGIYQVPNPSEQDVLNLIERAKKLGDEKLIVTLKSTNSKAMDGAGLYRDSHGKPVVSASAADFRAAEMLIEDLEHFQKGTV